MTNRMNNGLTEFKFFRPHAREVMLVGDFTRWCEQPISMLPVGDGWWKTSAPIAAGEYRFRYLADGTWYTDYAANGIERCEFGWDSVLVVSGRVNLLPETPARQVA